MTVSHRLSRNNQNHFAKKDYSNIQILKPARSELPKIDFSNSSKVVKGTKNFVVLRNGFPIRNRIFDAQVNHPNNPSEKLKIPLLRTNDHGVVHILFKPAFNEKNQIDANNSQYVPIKYSKRLGFVYKDNTDEGKKNPFYKTKFINKYLDIGLSEHFLRMIILQNLPDNQISDCEKSPVMHNWLNAVLGSDAVKKDYRDYNSHTERTKKGLLITDYTGKGLMLTGSAGLIATGIGAAVGVVPFAAMAVGGGVLAGSQAVSTPHHMMHAKRADISRERDSQLSVLENIQSVSGNIKIDDNLSAK